MHASHVPSACDGRIIQLHTPTGVERMTVEDAKARCEYASAERAALLGALAAARHWGSDDALPIDGAEPFVEAVF